MRCWQCCIVVVIWPGREGDAANYLCPNTCTNSVERDVTCLELGCAHTYASVCRRTVGMTVSVREPPGSRCALSMCTAMLLLVSRSCSMEYLHSRRVVHFDLKAGNLLVGWREGQPVAKVADFGLAKEAHRPLVRGGGWGGGAQPSRGRIACHVLHACTGSSTHTQSSPHISGVSSLRGTLPWTAPEIIRTPNQVTDKVGPKSSVLQIKSQTRWALHEL